MKGTEAKHVYYFEIKTKLYLNDNYRRKQDKHIIFTGFERNGFSKINWKKNGTESSNLLLSDL